MYNDIASRPTIIEIQKKSEKSHARKCCGKLIREKLQKRINSTTYTQLFINTTPTFATHLLHGDIGCKKFGNIN